MHFLIQLYFGMQMELIKAETQTIRECIKPSVEITCDGELYHLNDDGGDFQYFSLTLLPLMSGENKVGGAMCFQNLGPFLPVYTV